MSRTRRSSSSSSSESAKRSRSKSSSHPSYKYMITEAIWEEKKYVKGSSSSDIRHFILQKYDVDESRIKDTLSKTAAKMYEETDDGWACLKKVDGNFKLTPEWRKAWTKQFNKKTIRRKKKKRPADYPKHPRNAYLYYSTEVRKKRQEEYPDKSFVELTTLIANEWKNLKSSRKKKYDELAKKDRDRYRRELKEWEAKHPSESESESESRKKRRKRSRSKRSASESESEESRSKSSRKKKRRKNLSRSLILAIR